MFLPPKQPQPPVRRRGPTSRGFWAARFHANPQSPSLLLFKPREVVPISSAGGSVVAAAFQGWTTLDYALASKRALGHGREQHPQRGFAAALGVLPSLPAG